MRLDEWGIPTVEDLAKWDTGVWIHYSNHPDMKIHPQQFHQDPAGIYLFPESFKPEGSWFKMRHKFKVKSLATNVLDLSTLTKESAVEMLKKMVPEKHHSAYEDEIQKASDPIDTWWEMLKAYFVHVKGRAAGEWNKAFRNLGYDAIFDDTGSIMGNEVQLLVLDPSKVKVIERVDQGSTGFEEVTEVANKLAEMLRAYGEVSLVPPKRQKPTWSTGARDLEARVEVKNGDKYLNWTVSTRFHDNKDAVPSEIGVRLTGGAYDLRQKMSIGTSLSWNKKPWDYSELEREVKRAAAAEFGVGESRDEQIVEVKTRNGKELSLDQFISIVTQVAVKFGFNNPKKAYWQCNDFSQAVLAIGRYLGLPGMRLYGAMVQFRKPEGEIRQNQWVRHVFLKIGNMFYDWTARQFMPKSEFPYVTKSLDADYRMPNSLPDSHIVLDDESVFYYDKLHSAFWEWIRMDQVEDVESAIGQFFSMIDDEQWPDFAEAFDRAVDQAELKSISPEHEFGVSESSDKLMSASPVSNKSTDVKELVNHLECLDRKIMSHIGTESAIIEGVWSVQQSESKLMDLGCQLLRQPEEASWICGLMRILTG